MLSVLRLGSCQFRWVLANQVSRSVESKDRTPLIFFENLTPSIVPSFFPFPLSLSQHFNHDPSPGQTAGRVQGWQRIPGSVRGHLHPQPLRRDAGRSGQSDPGRPAQGGQAEGATSGGGAGEEEVGGEGAAASGAGEGCAGDGPVSGASVHGAGEGIEQSSRQ